jgi:hypothetical protein
MLPPTTLMGMPLPLLSRVVVDAIEIASARIGWLYGLKYGRRKPIRTYYSDPRYTRTVADARHVLLTEVDRYDVIEALKMSITGTG